MLAKEAQQRQQRQAQDGPMLALDVGKEVDAEPLQPVGPDRAKDGLALGGTGFLMVIIFGSGGTSPRIGGFDEVPIPLLSQIPIIGPAFFSIMVLMAVVTTLMA